MRWLAAALAGVFGAVLFGAMMPAADMMPMVAALYGLDGVTWGWFVHLVHGAIFGLIYAGIILAVARLDTPLATADRRPLPGAIPGAVYGAIIWTACASILMPVRIGAVTEMAPPVPDWNWMSFVGHLVFGVSVGVLYATLTIAAREGGELQVGDRVGA